MVDTNIDKKYELITRDLEETIIDETIVKKILAQRPLKIYWGTAPTSPPHIGYLVPMFKIVDFLEAGCDITILIADLHAILDNLKSSFGQVEARTTYYTTIIKEILKSLDVDINRIKFTKGTDFQLSDKYTLDVYRAHTKISVSEAKHSGAEVVKQSDNPKITGLIYPTLQAIDEEYLKVDCQLGGIDQRKIFAHSRSVLPSLGYKKRFYLMNKIVPGLQFEKKNSLLDVITPKDDIGILKMNLLNAIDSAKNKKEALCEIQKLVEEEKKNDLVKLEKMSSTNELSKINFLDTKKQIRTKINRVYCYPGDVDDNSLIPLLERIIFPYFTLKKMKFVIQRKIEHGGPIEYNSFDSLIKDFTDEKLHPGDLKSGIVDSLDLIVKPIRETFQEKDMMILINKAYGVNK